MVRVMKIRMVERHRNGTCASGIACGRGGSETRPRGVAIVWPVAPDAGRVANPPLPGLYRVIVCALVLLALCLAAPATVAAEPPLTDGRVAASIEDGRDSFGLRFGLLCFVGLALAGGAYKQYQTVSTARRGRTVSRRPQSASARPDTRNVAAPAVPVPMAAPPAEANARPGLRAVAAAPLGPSPAEERCAKAIAAAHRYDRRATVAAFRSALASDPAAKPSALPGFWEMPSGGHADLARVYLERRQGLDARSVLTVAMMLFPHNRELEMLAREAAVDRRDTRSA